MKISAKYRFIASLLSLSIFIGVTVPTGLHAMSEELCEQMKEMHHPTEHGIHCPMDGDLNAEIPNTKLHNSLDDLGLACACSIEEAPLKTETPVVQKVKTQVLAVVQILTENHTPNHEFDNHSYLISDSYSFPPIYIANETFLI